ncbi:gamete antigen 27/25 [Plasmodium brasilianum]|uniref:Gamete antigen 27/25 n=1 Tax=Plasmodium brasilianum TaxID=5824 RepID=A0ACB9Y0Z3_PLABR|nr:gamete antigen 27/25 [Plasmodium brasilianum]
MKNGESKEQSLNSENSPPHVYKYDLLKIGPVKEEVKKLGNIEFLATVDFLYYLLQYGTDKAKIFHMMEDPGNILNVVKQIELMEGCNFKDTTSRNKCVSRIKRRLNLIVIKGILTEEYCEQAIKYFWIEQKVDEEMSLKIDNQKSQKEKEDICYNETEIKRLISVLEKDKNIKFSEEMIENTIITIEDFLLDVLRITINEEPMKIPKNPEDQPRRPYESLKENSITDRKN